MIGTHILKIYTIGFTKIAASGFFNLLRKSGAKRLVDVRLNNVSQLAGFAKKNDLEYFLNNICDMDYVHLPALGPNQGDAGQLQEPTPRLGPLPA